MATMGIVYLRFDCSVHLVPFKNPFDLNRLKILCTIGGSRPIRPYENPIWCQMQVLLHFNGVRNELMLKAIC